ncbi:hypothetical protein LLG95_14700 [bacterium]|nr:hypothetical protein [bacterium]
MDDKQLSDWMNGDMPPEEAARFERDNTLDAAREWVAADPPGLARADQLPIPRVVKDSSFIIHHSSFPWRWLWQPAMAAALFIGGFFLGRVETVKPVSPDRPITQNAVTPAPAATPRQADDHSTQLAKADRPTRYVTRQDGRMIIETTLADSGAHATWVIDGSFKLASNDMKSN